MFYLWPVSILKNELESFHRDYSIKWSNIGFGEEITQAVSIEINFTNLISIFVRPQIFMHSRLPHCHKIMPVRQSAHAIFKPRHHILPSYTQPQLLYLAWILIIYSWTLWVSYFCTLHNYLLHQVGNFRLQTSRNKRTCNPWPGFYCSNWEKLLPARPQTPHKNFIHTEECSCFILLIVSLISSEKTLPSNLYLPCISFAHIFLF